MKRIDDKIKEIEKKDRTSRWLYYVIFAGLIGFLYFASTTRKEIDLKNAQIDELTIKNSETYKKLDSAYTKLEETYLALNNSLEPEEYWDHTVDENTVEAYIAFITNDWGIKKDKFIPKAIEQLKTTSPTGFEGWLFVGAKTNDGSYESRDIIEIIHRNESSENITNSEPQIGDIIRLKTTINRKTYKRKNLNGSNVQGWRNKTKAIVVDTYEVPNKTDFRIKIKYY